jgi:hypothetical protein
MLTAERLKDQGRLSLEWNAQQQQLDEASVLAAGQ